MAFNFDPNVINGAIGKLGGQYRVPGQQSGPGGVGNIGWNMSGGGWAAPAVMSAQGQAAVPPAAGASAVPGGRMQSAQQMAGLVQGPQAGSTGMKDPGPNPYLAKVYRGQAQTEAEGRERRNKIASMVIGFFTGGAGGMGGMGGGGGGGLGGLMGG